MTVARAVYELKNDEIAREVEHYLRDNIFNSDFVHEKIEEVIDEEKGKLAQVFDTRIKALDFAQLPTSSVLDAVFRPYRAKREFKFTKVERYIHRGQLERVKGVVIDYAVREVARERFGHDTSVRLLTRDFASEVDILTDELINIEVKASRKIYDEALVELAIQRIILNDLNNVKLRESKIMLVNVDFVHKSVSVRMFRVRFSDAYLNALRSKMRRAIRIRDALLNTQSVTTRIMRNMHFQRILEAHKAYTSLYRFYKRVREFQNGELVRINILDFASEKFVITRV